MEPTVPGTLPETSGWGALPRRMLRASLLDVDTYEEVESDRAATGQAFVVVVLSAGAAGLGGLDNHGVAGVFWHTVARVIFWSVWAWVTCLIGTRLLPTDATESDWGELLRTIGFASTPGLIHVLALFDRHPWGGSGVELQNVLYHAAEACQGSVIEVDDLPGHMREE